MSVGTGGMGVFFDTIYDEESGHRDTLEYGTQVYICFSGMRMGWSWALFMAQEIISHQCLLALGGDSQQLIRDRSRAPAVKPGCNPVGVYVDNVDIFGGTGGESSAAMARVQEHFKSLGIPFEVDHVDVSPVFQSLGLSFSFGDKVCV